MNICTHLQPIFDYELSRGNTIKEVSENWSKSKFVVDLEKTMDIGYISDNLIKYEWIQFWEFQGLHYPSQSGYVCNKCKHSIAGPKS